MLKQCGVCTKEFEPCNDCPSKAYAWRKTVCCIEHSVPFLAILGYKRGSTAKDEAKEVLKKISNIDYNNSVKDIVAEILAEPIVEDEVEIVEEETKSTKFKKNQ